MLAIVLLELLRTDLAAARMFCARTNFEAWERTAKYVIRVKNLFGLLAPQTQSIRSIQESAQVNVQMIVQAATLSIFSRLR